MSEGCSRRWGFVQLTKEPSPAVKLGERLHREGEKIVFKPFDLSLLAEVLKAAVWYDIPHVSVDLVAAASPRTYPLYAPIQGTVQPGRHNAPTQTKISKEDVVKAYQELGGTWTEVERVTAGSRIWELEGRTWARHLPAGQNQYDLYVQRAYGEQGLQAYRQEALDFLARSDRAYPYHKPARGGTNNSARMQCKRSQYHGFHPVDEKCPLCP